MKHCLAQRCAQQLSQCPSSAINEVCALAVRELAAEPSPNSAGMIAVKVVAAAPGESSPAGEPLRVQRAGCGELAALPDRGNIGLYLRRRMATAAREAGGGGGGGVM